MTSPLSGSDSVISRDDNLSLYRMSRTDNSDRCPNLPLHLLVEVTSRCNLSCKMCNVHHNKRTGININEVLLEQTYELAKTAATVSPFGLGEPLLNKDIAAIVRQYKMRGPSVAFVTNGMLLTEKISGELIDSGLDHISVSIDAAEPLLFAEIRRGADLNRISANIKALNHQKKRLGSANPSLSINVVVQVCNFSQLPEIINLAEKLEIFSINFSPVTIHEHIHEIRKERLEPCSAGWKEILEICRSHAEAKGIGIDTQRLYHVLDGLSPDDAYRDVSPCPEPFRFMAIGANGEVFPCCHWDIKDPFAVVSGLADAKDLEETWRNQKWQSLRSAVVAGRYPGPCRMCMKNFTRPFTDNILNSADQQ